MAGCVHQLIDAQVARTPEAIAVIDGARRWSYREVARRANQLANVLRAHGVGPETPVGIACERSAEMIVGLLAILKAGGAYVPIDPAHPPRRLEMIAADARLALIVTQAAALPRLPPLARCVSIEDAADAPTTAPPDALGLDAAMYILFTSGSTGRPKGVVTTHRAIASRLAWQQQVFPYAPGEVAAARTTLGFVDSVAEIFAPLASGVPLVVIGGEAQRDLALMIDEVAAARATRIVMVPSLLTTLFELCPDLAARTPALAYWFVGGEPVPVALVERFRAAMPGRKLINLYGATEVSGDATYFDFDRMPAGRANAPIGIPLRGVHARIVDDELREVPDGEVGEVVVSGVCLARGYLHRAELTAQRFVPNPFPEGGSLYRMGDLGRRLPTGDLEYLGRADQQVKIRGMRVELGEVEAALATAPGVTQAVAIAREDASARRTLVAFVTGDRALTAGELRAHLAARVPDYMVPTQLVVLRAFPINASGKIDRRALREWPLEVAPAGEPPATEDERRIAAAWQAVLGGGGVGRAQDLFELGGTSLSAMRIVALLREELQLAIPIRAIFEHPTVAGLAAHLATLRGRSTRRALVATPRPLPAELPLSHYQLPFWLFHALTGDLSVVAECFTVDPAALAGPGHLGHELDVERLQRAFAATIDELPGLWMALPRFAPVQRPVAGPSRPPCRFAVRDLRASLRPEAALLQEEADANNLAPFDLARPPLVNARLVRLRGGDHLMIAIPHIAVDMTSLDVIRRRLQARYAGPAAPLHAASLRDLIDWERRATPAELEAEIAYWRTIATGPAWTTLPARLFTARRAGARLRAFATRDLPDEAGLAAAARSRGVTLPIAVIGAVHAALAGIALRGDPTLLLMVEKRDHAAARELVTTLAALMRVRVPGAAGAAVGEVVDRVGAQLFASYDHSDHLMRRPTLFNDFWARAPRPLARLAGGLSGLLARRWPAAALAPDALAQIVFAIVPAPERRRGPRDVLACVNLWPEVTEPDRPGDWLRRRRGHELLLKPGDLVINTDPLIDRTLQITFSRRGGRLAVSLYGGAIDQAGLDELAAGITDACGQLARAARVVA